MRKKIFLCCFVGALLGLAWSTIITVIISLIVGDGHYYAVVPALIEDCGTELNAVLLQTLCSFLYGAAWACASLIWEKDTWSLLKKTVIHLTICSVFTFPVAFFMYWMPHSVIGILSYFGMFFIIYLLVWWLQYFSTKRKLAKINAAVREQ